jgi:hypothetical protein
MRRGRERGATYPSVRRIIAGTALVSALGHACSGAGGDQPFVDGVGAAGNGNPGAGRAGAGGITGDAGSGGSGVAGMPVIGVPDSGNDAFDDVTIEPDAACGIGTAEASLRPVTMFVMFDRSTSMVRAEPDPVTLLNRWETASLALKAFFGNPTADGLRVALRFFPDDRPIPGCIEVDCSAEACAEPLVDVGTLSALPAPDDAHEAALVDAIDSSEPMLPMDGMMAKGGTPISVALQGSVTWAAAHQGGNPLGRTVVLFVTDGQPAGCDERIAYITDIAAVALADSGVATYVVGLTDAMGEGLQQEDMDALALAGGTERAYFVRDGPTAAEDLSQTLAAIRGLALPCDFPMPEATNGGMDIDPRLVNVTYTAGDGAETPFTKVSGADTCADAKSWYYDDDDAPERVFLCPAACDLVTADPLARFEILVGCETVFEPPR